jgi:phosphohistidine phosphatase
VTLLIKNLILWRHADAEMANIAIGVDGDMARELTLKGKQQAKVMAHWLQAHLPKNLLLLSSPAVRAFETAEALKYNINVHQALKPGAALQDVLSVLENIKSPTQNLLIVGHQPWLGLLVAHLTGGADMHIKKGAIWWLRLSSSNPASIKASYDVYTVQIPSLMR